MWEIHTGDQVLTFLYAMIVGALLCFIYDILRSPGLAGIGNRTGAVFRDIFFSVIAAFVTFLFLLSRTDGEIRFYVLAGEGIGFLIFRGTVSRFLIGIPVAVFRRLIRCYQAIRRFLERFSCKTERFERKMMKNIRKIAKKIPKLQKNS